MMNYPVAIAVVLWLAGLVLYLLNDTFRWKMVAYSLALSATGEILQAMGWITWNPARWLMYLVLVAALILCPWRLPGER